MLSTFMLSPDNPADRSMSTYLLISSDQKNPKKQVREAAHYIILSWDGGSCCHQVFTQQSISKVIGGCIFAWNVLIPLSACANQD